MASMDTLLETLSVPSSDGSALSYLARPVTGSHPAVLLITDVFGLRPAVASMCERIASWGYVVLAPNLVYRRREVPLIEGVDLSDEQARQAAMSDVFALFVQTSLEDTARDADAWLDWLAARPDVSDDRFAITGYCRGGYIALSLAEALPERFAAAGLFHAGHLATDAPDSPHRRAGRLRARLLIRPADHDASATPESQAVLAEALDAAGVRYSQEVYPDALHGYAMSDGARYDRDAAERHFEELRALLDGTFGG